MSGWSMWVRIWPLFLFLSAASGAGNLIWLLAVLSAKGKKRTVGPALYALLLSMLAFFTVFMNFPSA